MKRLNELRQEYNRTVKSMRDMHDAAEKDNRGFNADENDKYQRMRAGLEDLQSRIQREQDLVDQELRGAQTIAPNVEGTVDDPIAQRHIDRATARDSDPYAQTFRSYLVGGNQQLSEEQRRLMAERRDMSLTLAAGGATVPQGFYNQLLQTQRLWGGFIDPTTVTLVETDSGNNIPVPVEDDTANAAAIVAEGASLTTSADPTFNNVTLGAFTYRTLVRVSLELLQDSAFNVEQYLNDRFAIRLWRGFNGHASTGTNSGQPQGLFNASVGASIGATAPTGNTTAFPYTSLVALEHSVDPLYRLSPKARWMFSDGVLQNLKSQLDSTNRPIWMPDYMLAAAMGNAGTVSFPGSILGYRYIINPDAPVMAANARSLAFGDFSYYMTRRVRGMAIIRAQERFIDAGQIGFYLFARMDGKYANPTATAARAPIRLGQNSAT